MQMSKQDWVGFCPEHRKWSQSGATCSLGTHCGVRNGFWKKQAFVHFWFAVSSSSWPWPEGGSPPTFPGGNLFRLPSGSPASRTSLPSFHVKFSRLDVLSQPVPPTWDRNHSPRQLIPGDWRSTELMLLVCWILFVKCIYLFCLTAGLHSAWREPGLLSPPWGVKPVLISYRNWPWPCFFQRDRTLLLQRW